MSNKTPNHELNLYTEGDENWTHTPDMETIEERLVVRDLEENRDNYTPYTDALFFARDSERWYVGEGTSWTLLGTIGESITAEGITATPDHVGPLHQGNYHNTRDSDQYGIAFEAVDDLALHSCVIDVATALDSETLTIEFYQVDNLETNVIETPTDPIDTTTTNPLSEGPNRVELGFTTPDNDGYSRYALFFVVPSQADGSTDLFRRIPDWTGWEDYSNLSEQGINLLQGGRRNNATSGDYSNYYYYFFDIGVGEKVTRVRSPWSHDVEEIYMRPRDPEEEYNNVSPRSLWIDTSES